MDDVDEEAILKIFKQVNEQEGYVDQTGFQEAKASLIGTPRIFRFSTPPIFFFVYLPLFSDTGTEA